MSQADDKWIDQPTPDGWAQILIIGIGVYEEFPRDHEAIWPIICERLKNEGYRIVKRDDALFAEKIHE